MMEVPNFREFYPNTPIQISEKDWQAVQQEGKYRDLFANCTHWLIALEGKEANNKKFEWRVVIFPSEKTGRFNYKTPFFQSSFFQTFHDAFEYLRKSVSLAKQDQLTTLHQA